MMSLISEVVVFTVHSLEQVSAMFILGLRHGIRLDTYSRRHCSWTLWKGSSTAPCLSKHPIPSEAVSMLV